MKSRVLLVAGLLTASATVYAQTGLGGKWQTDSAPAALEAQKNPPPPPADGGGGGRGRGRGGGGGAIQMDLKVDASGKISGMVNEIGNGDPLTIESGMITGKMITWVTQPRGVTWTLELTDDNTLTVLSRAIPGRGPGGGGPGGGGGAPGGGGPGGPGGGAGAAPGGGAPGGGGPGGGAPGGGAPGGGGPGGGGGGRGRGPAQPIVLHRMK